VGGRFASPDEFVGGPEELFDFSSVASENPTFYADMTQPQSLNKYQYCLNNPYHTSTTTQIYRGFIFRKVHERRPGSVNPPDHIGAVFYFQKFACSVGSGYMFRALTW
jgi:hypothetical protein